MRILLDENVPEGVGLGLPGHEARTVQEMGWGGITNGKLLTIAEEAEFDLLLTGDLNLRHQNNLSGRRIAVVGMTATHWPTVRANLAAIRQAVDQAAAGTYSVVTLPRPPLRRRPRPGGSP